MTSIAIVENNPKHLQIISNYISLKPRYTLLTTATNGFEFINYCYHNRQLPTVVLIDVEMNVMDGVTIVDFLTQYFPSIKCVVISNHHHKEMLEDMIACGAMGILWKLFTVQNDLLSKISLELQHKFEPLDACIESVVNNKFYFDKIIDEMENNISQQLNREALIAHRQQQRLANAAFNFIDKEQVIVALCAGTSAKLADIANALSISVQNLKLHLSNIFKKTGATDRLELTHICNRKGIVKNVRNIVGIELW
jgi:DNA-binding NarL/FixJ family response regulator